LLRALFVSALAVGIVASGGEGVSSNAFMEISAILGIITALAFGYWRDKLNFSRTGQLAGALLPLVFALPVVTKSPQALGSLWNFERTWRTYERDQVEFGRATEFLAEHPGDALCDNLLMCSSRTPISPCSSRAPPRKSPMRKASSRRPQAAGSST
jgi:hypothetical protein